MFVLGLGLGLVMQVLVLAVQNAVDYAELGVATSGATLFRSIGGSLGTAVLGAIFTNRLTSELAGSPAAQVGSGSIDPSAVERLPAAVRDGYTGAFTDALSHGLPRRRGDRRRRLPALLADRGAAAAPDGRDGRRGRGLRLARRAATRCASSRASSPGSSGASARARSSSARSTPRTSTCRRARRGCSCRARRGVAARRPGGDRRRAPVRRRAGCASSSSPGSPSAASSSDDALTDAGHATAERLIDARHDCLHSLIADWQPDDDPRVNDAVARLARELAREVPALGVRASAG